MAIGWPDRPLDGSSHRGRLLTIPSITSLFAELAPDSQLQAPRASNFPATPDQTKGIVDAQPKEPSRSQLGADQHGQYCTRQQPCHGKDEGRPENWACHRLRA